MEWQISGYSVPPSGILFPEPLTVTSPVAQVVAGTRVTTGATWLDHAMDVTRSLGITVDFPVEDMLSTARACADTRRKAVKQWKRTFVVPAVRAHEQRWFVLQLAALNNEGVVPYRDLLPVREPLTPGIRWAPWSRSMWRLFQAWSLARVAGRLPVEARACMAALGDNAAHTGASHSHGEDASAASPDAHGPAAEMPPPCVPEVADGSHDHGSQRSSVSSRGARRRSKPLAPGDPAIATGRRELPSGLGGARVSASVPSYDFLPHLDDAAVPSFGSLPSVAESGATSTQSVTPRARPSWEFADESDATSDVTSFTDFSHIGEERSHVGERLSAQKVLASAMRWGRVVSHESVMARAAEQSQEQVRRRTGRQKLETVREGSRMLLGSAMAYGVGRLIELLLRGFDPGQRCPLGWRGGEVPQGPAALASLAAEACTVLAGCLLAARGLRRPSVRAHYGVLLALGLYAAAFPLLPTEPSCDDQWRHRQCARGKDWWRSDQQGCGPQGLTSSVTAMAIVCMSPHIVPELKPMLLFVALFVAGYLAASSIYLYATELGYYTWVDVMVAIILLSAATVMAAYKKYKMQVQQQYIDLLYHRKADASRKLLDLLQDFLPDHTIARMLKHPDATTAEQIPKASVLFLVISDFDGHMSRRTPDQLLDFLNTLFGKIDRICLDCEVTKIETVGEEYVAAVGVKPEDYSNGVDEHEEVLSHLIVAALGIFMWQEGDLGDPLTGVRFRMGLHTGPVVAGVIGQKLPRFRLFGDTMNTAARMMQKGVDGELQFGEETRACMPSWARYSSRGKVEMKGKGQVDAYLLDRLGEGSEAKAWEQMRSYGLRKAKRGSLDSIMPPDSEVPDDHHSAEQEDAVTGCTSACTWICSDWEARLKRLGRGVVQAVRSGTLVGDEADIDIEWLREFYYFRLASHLGRRSDRVAAVMIVLTAAEALAAELLQPRMEDVFGVKRTRLFLVMRAVLLALMFRWRVVARHKDWIIREPRAAELWRLAHACALLALQFTAYGLLVEPVVDGFSLDLSALEARDKLLREPLRLPMWQLMFLLWYGVTVLSLQLRLGPTVCFVVFSLIAPLVLSVAFPAVRNLASSVQLVSIFIMGLMGIQIAGADETQDRDRFKAERHVKSVQHRMDSILSQLVPPLVADQLNRRQASRSVSLRHKSLECTHSYQQATIACSDLVGFTALASTRTATEVVELVSELFGRFDDLSDVYKICKIETVGDAYIAGQAARPLTSVYRPISVVVFAVEIVQAVRSWSRERDVPLDCRVGVHTGGCVGGVVGVEMKRYHLFGHLLTVLELLESTAPTGQVHLSRACMQALEEQACAESLCSEILVCAPREELALKTSKGDPVLYHDIGGAPTFVVQSCAPKLYDPEAGSEADSDTASVGAMVI
ncbi:unnamed protein product [Prorocentrum cordatum]|uniref:Guanylate cyclase domain-containing protein n=1 Tax=Prorocentrum cordatum TaxID=2364126 RepID=A0ABN9REE4_9DINO|nr:unnamed protein product [Polarella glacialis]